MLQKIHFLSFIALFFVISCIHYYMKQHKNHHGYSPAHQQTFPSSLNQVIRDISLFPINSERIRLSELENKKAIVFFMREKNCPLSEKHGPRIARLEKQYSKKGIQFIYNYVGQVKSKESAMSDLKKFGFKELYLIDSKQTIVHALSATTTGDVFILTPQRKVIYKGPLDDQYHILKSAIKSKNNYVVDILDNILSKKNIIPQEIQASGCIITRPMIKKKVFWSDVAPIIQKKCTICHNPTGSGPMNYLSYEDVIGRQSMFKYVIENDLMPPWYLDPNTGPWQNDLSLTPKEKVILLKWVNDGCPNNKIGKDQPLEIPKKNFIKDPDYVIKLKDPIKIPKTGIIPYKEFVITPDFKEDKWIKAYQFILKPKVIHHAFVTIGEKQCALHMTPKKKLQRCLKYENDLLIWVSSRFGYQQGDTEYKDFGKHVGLKIPKGAFLIFQIHYNSIGKEVIDHETKVKIKFHSKPPEYQRISLSVSDVKINIPRNTSDYLSKFEYKIKRSMRFVATGSHMHLRGKAASILLLSPKGNQIKVFRQDPYNYNFQNMYHLQTPITISKDSKFICKNWFDNSINNPVNPNPMINVQWGKNVLGEMSICAWRFIIPSSANTTEFF